jgi:hypothetical protein
MIIASALIAFSSWLAGKKPALAGFIIALPISSMIAIAFTQAEWQDAEKSVTFAKSIFVSIPLSLMFFLPFLFAKQLALPFWGIYALGIVCLASSYGVHRLIFGA